MGRRGIRWAGNGLSNGVNTMSDEHYQGDNFTKWLLGITASVVVAIGGWLGVTLTTLNARFGVVETQLFQLNRSVDKLGLDSERTRADVDGVKERLIRLEMKVQIDNTRVGR